MAIPQDYLSRVYAGVLGKIIGVYLGRPIEGCSFERLIKEFGEVTYYIHHTRKLPLIVTDDDITGTFTFLRRPSRTGSWHAALLRRAFRPQWPYPTGQSA
jgi:hypothetical protein